MFPPLFYTYFVRFWSPFFALIILSVISLRKWSRPSSEKNPVLCLKEANVHQVPDCRFSQKDTQLQRSLGHGLADAKLAWKYTYFWIKIKEFIEIIYQSRIISSLALSIYNHCICVYMYITVHMCVYPVTIVEERYCHIWLLSGKKLLFWMLLFK